jgi:hypothetical protein
MTMRITILILILLTRQSAFGQNVVPVKVFHKHVQTCHYVGTTEEDFVIALYRDSTIKVTKYISNYSDGYRSVLKQEFEGKFVALADTILVEFSKKSATIKKNPGKYGSAIYATHDNKFYQTPYQYPPNKYVLKQNEIISLDNLLPGLDSTTIVNIVLLDTQFNSWDKTPDLVKVFGVR